MEDLFKEFENLHCVFEQIADTDGWIEDDWKKTSALEHKNHIIHSTRHLDFVQRGRKLTDTDGCRIHALLPIIKILSTKKINI